MGARATSDDFGVIELILPAKSENVAIVRHTLAGLAAACGMDADAIADLKTVVTEACMNVVVHAYGDEGPLEVRAWPEEDRLAVAVRDYGPGIRPRAEPERESLRLGLALIAALSSSVELSSPPGGGTRVLMKVALSGDDESDLAEAPGTPAGMRARVSAGELVGPILSRVVGMYAARADFSVDRLSDAILLSDAISSQHPEDYPERVAQIAIAEENGSFTVSLGPLREGGGERLMDRMRIPEIGASLEGLANEIAVESDGAGDFVRLRIDREE